jgi:hypothetical protein
MLTCQSKYIVSRWKIIDYVFARNLACPFNSGLETELTGSYVVPRANYNQKLHMVERE